MPVDDAAKCHTTRICPRSRRPLNNWQRREARCSARFGSRSRESPMSDVRSGSASAVTVISSLGISICQSQLWPRSLHASNEYLGPRHAQLSDTTTVVTHTRGMCFERVWVMDNESPQTLKLGN